MSARLTLASAGALAPLHLLFVFLASNLLLDAAHGRTVLLLTHRTEGLDRVDRTAEIAGGRLRTLTTADA